MYNLRIPPGAKKFIKGLPEKYKMSAVEALEDIKFDPFLGEKLERDLGGRRSYKFGVYRIIYKVRKKEKLVEILRIGHRQSFYN